MVLVINSFDLQQLLSRIQYITYPPGDKQIQDSRNL